MRQSYLKNAALLTGSDVVLRLAGMGPAHLAGKRAGRRGDGPLPAGAGGVFTVRHAGNGGRFGGGYPAHGRGTQRPGFRPRCGPGMLRRLLAAGLVLGLFAAALQLATADLAARWWLGDVRAVGALRVSALGMPWMAVSAVLRGFFIARRHVAPMCSASLRSRRCALRWWHWRLPAPRGLAVGVRCMLVLGATAVSEAVSALCMLAFYRRDARSAFAGQKAVRPADPARRLWEILWPVEGGRVLASALHTAGEYAGARLPCGISGKSGRAHRRAGAVRGAERAWLCRCSPSHLACWAVFRCC